jgi:outer membrane protein assembly factor BamB
LNTPRLLHKPPVAVLGLLALAALILTACGSGPGDSWAGVASDPERDTVYISFNNKVIALDSTNGEIRWKYPPEDDRGAKIFAIPALDNGTLYVGDYKGNLHAVNIDDGSSQWIYEPEKETIIGPISPTPVDRVISGVAFDDDLVYFGLGSRNVVAVSRENAKEVWTFETNHGVWATPLYVPADPEVEGSQAVLYVVSLDHYLYALAPKTGEELWRKDLGGAAPGNMAFDPASNRIYVGTFLSELLAIDVAERQIVDRFQAEGWIWGGPALEVQEDGTHDLYFGDLEGNLYAVRFVDGAFETVWQKSVSDEAIRATPLLSGDLVIVGSQDKRVYAFAKADGAGRWDEETEGEVLSNLVALPATDDNPPLVIASTTNNDQLAVAFISESGAKSWTYAD